MKNKQSDKPYSLTAKERKELRNGSAVSGQGKKTPQIDGDETGAGLVSLSSASEKTRMSHNKKIALILTSVFTAIILIVLAILTPTVFVPMIKYGDIDNPVAVIKLSNGESIEFEIYEKEVPRASTNFLYLAKKGFFNDTIIFDMTNNYVRFGQYESYAKSRTENKEFLKNITDIKIPTTATSSDNVFDYRLTKDTAITAANIIDKYNSFAYLSLMYSASGVDFQICGEEGASEYIYPKTSGAGITLKGYAFARALKSSEAAIKKLIGLERGTNDTVYWTGPKETIRIKSIRIYNLNSSKNPDLGKNKWRDFKWSDYFKPEYITWSGGSGFEE